ncbi:MAG: hypothetical protein HND54_10955 [Bacteroidetes bacterium]|nr:hypothetical protein [Bacteroidota bacterium]MCB0803726.1 hypothetical protein [Flavobacteriales bacterium]NOG58242.1 hypothetical protein [Bacteroidota bacterium]
MIKKWMVYNEELLERFNLREKANMLFKSGLIDKTQELEIRRQYKTPFYTPTIAIKALLFLAGILGVSTISGPLTLLFSGGGDIGLRIMTFIVGFGVILLNDRILIRDKYHYKSGLTRALSYSGSTFIYFALLGYNLESKYAYLLLALGFTSIIYIRYIDLLALAASILLFYYTLFSVFYDLGGLFQNLIPIVFMLMSWIFYVLIRRIETKNTSEIYSSSFTIGKSIFLILLYASGNYYVVRELSISLMGLSLEAGENIPFYLLFYVTSTFIPLAYLLLGIKNKSILFIRFGIICLILSFITLKYYYSFGMPVLTITLTGAFLIGLALGILNYLKRIRKGFTREKLLHKDWDTEDFSAIIISQTAGGVPQSEKDLFQGGQFGGGGAGGQF